MPYSKKVIDHFTNPHRIGALEDADGTGTVGDPVCGDFLRVYIKSDGERITDLSFLCQGCPAAIACGSATTDLAIGKTLDEARRITEEQVAEYLEGMPEQKMHCSNLGVQALRAAIANLLGLPSEEEKNASLPVIERLRLRLEELASDTGLLDKAVRVEVGALSPEEAIGHPRHDDYPLLKGKEVMLEARVGGGVGQAFTSAPKAFGGTVREALDLPVTGDDVEAHQNRGILVATGNAICSHAGVAITTSHCLNGDPEECALVLAEAITWMYGQPKIALVGLQPRMLAELAKVFPVRVVDLDPDNIGTEVHGVKIEAPEAVDDLLEWCDMAMVTGSTLVNGSIDRFVGLDKRVTFYGVTIAAAEPLLGLKRFCPRAR